MSNKPLTSPELESFIEYLNTCRKVKLEVTNPNDLRYIAATLDMRMSPENLTNDGELHPEAVAAKVDKYSKVAKEIKLLDPSIQFLEF